MYCTCIYHNTLAFQWGMYVFMYCSDLFVCVLLLLLCSIEEELKTAVAPKRARKKSYSSLNREVVSAP